MPLYNLQRHYINICKFQFEITNTLDDQILEDISIALDVSEGFQYLNEFRCPVIRYQETGNVYIYLKFPDDSVDTIGNSTLLIYLHNIGIYFR